MPADDDVRRVWRAFAEVASRFFAAGPAGARLGGPGWFAALANEPSGELNVCGLTPEATATSARALYSCAATDLPLIVFVSEHADPQAGAFLEANGLVDSELLERSILHAASSGTAQMWIAWDGAEPISVVWIVRHEEVLGVMEMMTPARHQRRGTRAAHARARGGVARRHRVHRPLGDASRPTALRVSRVRSE